MKNIFITNIPTPYRVSMWNQLSDICQNQKKIFIVYFMSESEPNRNWQIKEPFKFDYKQWNMRTYSIKGFFIRFNALFALDAIKSGSHLILGSSWNDPNVIFISLLKRFGIIRNRISFWTEANKLTVGAKNDFKFKYILRKIILGSADGVYFIPGKMSEITLNDWGINTKNKIVHLPNIPHAKFDENIGSWRGSGELTPVLTIVARLDESTKGIKNFLASVGSERLKKIKLNIIGSGSDYSEYKNYIDAHNLAENVFLIGELPTEKIVRSLQASDAFVLPSYSDPSPLSLVEAIKIGLPLLVSNHCGNHYECLVEGENGFSFDPTIPKNIQQAFDRLLEKRLEFDTFSKNSIIIANKNFSTIKVLKNLSEYLL